MERSSLDAVIRHAAEIGLDDGQVQRLKNLDDVREQRARDARAELGVRVEPPPGAMSMNDPTMTNGQGMNGMNGQQGMNGMNGQGMNGGMGSGMNGMAGMGPGQGGPLTAGPTAMGRARRRGPSPQMQALQAHLDELDTQAYFAGEAMLTDAQKQLAQKVATKYRVSLYEWRDKMKDAGFDDAL